jgi:hypothetical protein
LKLDHTYCLLYCGHLHTCSILLRVLLTTLDRWQTGELYLSLDHPVVWLYPSDGTMHSPKHCIYAICVMPLLNTIPQALKSKELETLTEIHRHRAVKVQAHVNDITHILILQDILYILSNQYNLLLLGRWDSHNRHFKSNQGTLSLIDQDGKVIACGLKLKSNLYKMKICSHQEKVL